MLKKGNKSQEKLKNFTFNLELVLIVIIKELVHQLLQVFIFVKQSVIKNNM